MYSSEDLGLWVGQRESGPERPGTNIAFPFYLYLYYSIIFYSILPILLYSISILFLLYQWKSRRWGNCDLEARKQIIDGRRQPRFCRPIDSYNSY